MYIIVSLIIVVVLSWLYLSTEKELNTLKSAQAEQSERGNSVIIYCAYCAESALEIYNKMVAVISAECKQNAAIETTSTSIAHKFPNGVTVELIDTTKIDDNTPFAPCRPYSVFVDKTIAAYTYHKIQDSWLTTTDVYFYTEGQDDNEDEKTVN